MTSACPDCEAVLIAGPTASGKSALALALAEARDGVIINADALQVYRDLAVLTARPTPADERRAPHRLYGHVPADQAYSVARWADDLRAVLAALRGQGRLPIIVGGTGLYFHAIEHGLSPVPPVPGPVRARVRGLAEAEGAAGLHARLVTLDPLTAGRLRPGDTQRLARALEVFEASGRPLALWQETRGVPLIDGQRMRRLVLMPGRDWLYPRIDRRFADMVAEGGLGEARALASLDPALPAARALGLPQLRAHLAGACSLADAIAAAQRETRRFAKRQMTWFRGRMSHWPALDPQQGVKALLAMIDDGQPGS